MDDYSELLALLDDTADALEDFGLKNRPAIVREAAAAIRALQDELAAATRIIEMQDRELRALRAKA